MAVGGIHGPPYKACLALCLTLLDNWHEIDGRLLLQTGRSIEDLSLRHALSVAYVWLMVRRPEEIAAREAVDEALVSDIAVGGAAAVSELSEGAIESLLDSF